MPLLLLLRVLLHISWSFAFKSYGASKLLPIERYSFRTTTMWSKLWWGMLPQRSCHKIPMYRDPDFPPTISPQLYLCRYNSILASSISDQRDVPIKKMTNTPTTTIDPNRIRNFCIIAHIGKYLLFKMSFDNLLGYVYMEMQYIYVYICIQTMAKVR